ncbi:MAG: thioesterase family protein [Pseudomonadota bacterium]
MTTFAFHSEPVQEQWLDLYGHLNEAYYLVPFSNATWKMQDHFGVSGGDYFDTTGCAMYTVETHMRYLSDVRMPANMEIETMILGYDAKRLWFAHCMQVEGTLCATAEFMLLHYDTREQRTTPMPDTTQALLQEAQLDELPNWVGRSLSLQKR